LVDWASAGGGRGVRLVAVDLLVFIRMLIFQWQILVVQDKIWWLPPNVKIG
jgi:hypothetical protein